MLCIITCFACQQKPIKVEEEPKSEAEIIQETKARLLKEAIEQDSVDTYSPGIFFRFLSGYIFNDTIKNAVYFCPLSDSTTVFELYTLKEGKWIKNDTLQNLDPGLWCTVRFLDYNFDGQKDIRYVHTLSNGSARSYGYTIIINPQTKQLKELKYMRDYGELWPDAEKQVVESSRRGSCPHRGGDVYHGSTECTLTHRWIKDSLIVVREDCTCYD